MLGFGALQITCVCVFASMCVCACLLVYDTVSLRPPAVSPKGREKSAAVYIFVCLFLSLCESESVCVWCTSQPNRDTGRQAFSTERERSEADQTQAN